METIINDFVKEHFAASIIVIMVAVMLLIFLVWKIAILWSKFKSLPCDNNSRTLEELKDKSFSKNELPCELHRDKIEVHSVSVSRIDTTLLFLTKNIEEMNSLLHQVNKNTPFTQQQSPLKISERGWKVVNKLGIDKMFSSNWERIKQLIDKEVTNKSAYDINEFCIKYAVVYPEKFLQQEEIDILKNDAYVQGLTLMEYMKIIAVMARDRYFEENNINIQDISAK